MSTSIAQLSSSWLPSALLGTASNVNLDVYDIGGISFEDLQFSNGESYRGGWRNDTPEGEGRYVWSDGSVYEGSWHEGLKHGWGKYSWPNGTTYLGEWRGGHLQGFGTLDGVDGSRYHGNWHANLKHGYGTKWYPNGDRYEGLWRNGRTDGPGRYVWANGNEYDGEWRSGKMHGRGTLKWKTGHRYDGEWLEGLEHGIGVFTWPDGGTFEGFWSNGKKHGVGVFRPAPGKHSHGLSAYSKANNDDELEDATLSDQAAQGRTNDTFEGAVQSPKARGGSRPADAGLAELKATAGGEKAQVYICEYIEGTLVHEENLNQEDLDTVFGKPEQHQNAEPGRKFGRRGRRRREDRMGETIFKGHRSFDLMLDLQLGIRYTIGTLSKLPPPQQLNAAHFDEKIWLKFPREGSEVTPPHPSTDFNWKDYCPTAFRRLRNLFGVDESEYILSVCGDQSLRELPSPGKSGSVFFLSHDEKFIIKTMRKEEVHLLLTALPRYVNHVAANPDTLLTRFYGVHRIKPANGRKVRFVVMTNIFRTDLRVHKRFDLKGSTYKRTIGANAEGSAVGKDLDLDTSFIIQPKIREKLTRVLTADCAFLEGVQVMDYSLLLGVHLKKLGNEPEGGFGAATDKEDDGGFTTADEVEAQKAARGGSALQQGPLGLWRRSKQRALKNEKDTDPTNETEWPSAAQLYHDKATGNTSRMERHSSGSISSDDERYLGSDDTPNAGTASQKNQLDAENSISTSTVASDDFDVQVTRSMRSLTMSMPRDVHMSQNVAVDAKRRFRSSAFGIGSFMNWRKEQIEKKRQLKQQKLAAKQPVPSMPHFALHTHKDAPVESPTAMAAINRPATSGGGNIFNAPEPANDSGAPLATTEALESQRPVSASTPPRSRIEIHNNATNAGDGYRLSPFSDSGAAAVAQGKAEHDVAAAGISRSTSSVSFATGGGASVHGAVGAKNAAAGVLHRTASSSVAATPRTNNIGEILHNGRTFSQHLEEQHAALVASLDKAVLANAGANGANNTIPNEAADGGEPLPDSSTSANQSPERTIARNASSSQPPSPTASEVTWRSDAVNIPPWIMEPVQATMGAAASQPSTPQTGPKTAPAATAEAHKSPFYDKTLKNPGGAATDNNLPAAAGTTNEAPTSPSNITSTAVENTGEVAASHTSSSRPNSTPNVLNRSDSAPTPSLHARRGLVRSRTKEGGFASTGGGGIPEWNAGGGSISSLPGGGGGGASSKRELVTSPTYSRAASLLSSKLSGHIDQVLIQDLMHLARYRMLGHAPTNQGQFRAPTILLASRTLEKPRGELDGWPSLDDALPVVDMTGSRGEQPTTGGGGNRQSKTGPSQQQQDVISTNRPSGVAQLPARAIPLHAAAGNNASSSTAVDQGGEDVVLFMGLIDWLQPYNMRKKLEHGYKAVVQDKKGVSVVEPKAYAKRLLKFIGEKVFPVSRSGSLGGDQKEGGGGRGGGVSVPTSPTAATSP